MTLKFLVWVDEWMMVAPLLELGSTERAGLVQGLNNELDFIYVEVP